MGCNYLSNNIYVNNNGLIKPCCEYEPLNPIYVQNIPLKNGFNHSEFIDVKNAIDSGQKPTQCNSCWKKEEAGLPSHRHNRKTTIKIVEISVSNECNLTCLYCNEASSTKWFKWAKELGLQTSKQDWREHLDLNFDFDKLVFYGGEPFLNKKLFSELEKLPKNKILGLSTNGTFYIKKFLDILNQFDRVDFTVSLDGFEKNNDYIRYHSSWENVSNNVSLFSKFSNIKVSIHTVMSILNYDDWEDIKKFGDEFGFGQSTCLMNMFGRDVSKYFDLKYLPYQIKMRLKEKYTETYPFKSYLDYMFTYTSTPEDWKNILNEFNRFEKLKKNTMECEHPSYLEIKKFVNDYSFDPNN